MRFEFDDGGTADVMSVEPWRRPVSGPVAVLMPERDAWDRVTAYGGEAWAEKPDGGLLRVARIGNHTLGFRAPRDALDPRSEEGWRVRVMVDGRIHDAFYPGPDRPTPSRIHGDVLSFAATRPNKKICALSMR